MEFTPILSLLVTIGSIIIATIVMIYKLGGFVEEINKRFENIDSKLQEHDKKFEHIDSRLIKIEDKLDDVDKRLITLEGEVKSLRVDVSKVENRLERLENRIEKTEDRYILFLSGKLFSQEKTESEKLSRESIS